MSYDQIEIGPAPANENCEQVPYRCPPLAIAEAETFAQEIRFKLGVAPKVTRLFVKANPHDFGTYYTVVCEYDSDNGRAVEYAFRCEREAPTEWSQFGKQTMEKLYKMFHVKANDHVKDNDIDKDEQSDEQF